MHERLWDVLSFVIRKSGGDLINIKEIYLPGPQGIIMGNDIESLEQLRRSRIIFREEYNKLSLAAKKLLPETLVII